MNKQVKVISYARVNTFQQYGEARTQSYAIEDYAKRLNLKIAKVFEACSTRYAKDELESALIYCKFNPDIKFLVVCRYDRISSNKNDFAQWKKAFQECGVQIKSITQPTDEMAQDKFTESKYVLTGHSVEDNI